MWMSPPTTFLKTRKPTSQRMMSVTPAVKSMIRTVHESIKQPHFDEITFGRWETSAIGIWT